MDYKQLHTNHPEFRWEKVDDYYASGNTGNAGELSRHTVFVHIPAGEIVRDGWSGAHRAPLDDGTYTLWEYTSNNCLEFFQWEKED